MTTQNTESIYWVAFPKTISCFFNMLSVSPQQSKIAWIIFKKYFIKMLKKIFGKSVAPGLGLGSHRMVVKY